MTIMGGPDLITTTVCFLLLVSTTFFLLLARRIGRVLRQGGKGTRRGMSIQVTDRAVAHRALVEHSAAFLNRPTGVTPSSIVTGDRHCSIMSAPYGPYWRAVRRNMAAGVLHPSNLGLLADTRARVLDRLLRDLRSGAPAAETLYFSVYSLLAEMCFGEDVVSGLGEERLRAMHKLQRHILSGLSSFGVLVTYPRMGKLLYPSRWRQVLALRRQRDEMFLPIIAQMKKTKNNNRMGPDPGFITYVDSLLDLRIPQEDDGSRTLTDGELVSLVSEFLGTGTETTASTLQWTMANLTKSPDLQQKLHVELDAVACNQRIEEAELSRMPYLKATVLESLRRHPPIPFVLRHMGRDEATEVLGLTSVPDHGTTVNFLVRRISHDATEWSDPLEFKPERFMSGRDADLTCTRELRMMPFGAGRRSCPGITPAMLHLEYFVANLVKEFEWCEADGDDNAIDLTEFHGFFLTIMKRPLRARLVPREAE